MTLENTAESLSGFAGLGITGTLLAETIRAGYAEPKPIQTQAIPPMLAGRDVLGIAQTGSGKTAAFALPILSKIIALGTKRQPRTARALILVPTRELAVQIDETIRLLARGSHVSTALVLGGVSRNSQVKRMQQGVDFLIATPGRLTDLVREGEAKLHETRWLILDEADRMLDMGFINDVKKLARATNAERQTALFSATMPDEIASLAVGLMRDPVRVSVAPQGTTAAEITESLVMARTKQKRSVLADLLSDENYRSVIVFARTKHGADKVTRNLQQDGFSADVIHGNKSQNARQRALNGFRDGSVRILVATDIAARGIDVPGISLVVNYDLPDEPETYVHRIGRTGRNGMSGASVTLCDPEETSKLRAVEKVTRKRIAVSADHTGKPDPAPVRPAPRAANDTGAQSAPSARPSANPGRHTAARPQQKPAAARGHAKPAAPSKPHGQAGGREDLGQQQRPRNRRRRFNRGPAKAA